MYIYICIYMYIYICMFINKYIGRTREAYDDEVTAHLKQAGVQLVLMVSITSCIS
jgi:hypothetical protein